MAAPSLSAIGSIYFAKLSAEPSDRPPEITILAEASSGRSDLLIVSLWKRDTAGSAAGVISSIGAAPLSPTAEHAAVRPVITALVSVVCTVWIALPAYIGRWNVSGELTLMISDR